MTWRPTALTLADEACPAALDFYEDGTPYDRDIFAAGTAAHHVLQAVGEATNERAEILDLETQEQIARAVCKKLIGEGRTFDGWQEPPLQPHRVWQGRDVAMEWLAGHPLEPGGHYELGVAVGQNWQPCAYSDAWLKTAIDHLSVEESESGERVLIVRDFKSSWATDAGRLDHMQHRIQALLALAHFPDVDVIRREVVNLRSRVTYTHELYAAFPDTEAVLDEWRADVTATIEALEVHPRVANPGARCIGCPYLGVCVDGRDYLEHTSDSASAEELARAYAVAVAEMGRLRDLLKLAAGENAIELEDATVGYQRQGQSVLTDTAYGNLLDEWLSTHPELTEASVRSLLRALDFSKGSAEKVLKVLYSERADIEHRREWLAANTEPSAKRVFKVKRK